MKREVQPIDRNDIVANRMKTRRIELGLSLEEVSSIAEISKSTLQRYETGNIKNIPYKRLESIATALKTSVNWLTGWTKDAEDVTLFDKGLKEILYYLGYRLDTWPHYQTIYIRKEDGTGTTGRLTFQEYKQFRANISSYISFVTENTVTAATENERKRLEAEELAFDAFIATYSGNSGSEEEKKE